MEQHRRSWTTRSRAVAKMEAALALISARSCVYPLFSVSIDFVGIPQELSLFLLHELSVDIKMKRENPNGVVLAIESYIKLLLIVPNDLKSVVNPVDC